MKTYTEALRAALAAIRSQLATRYNSCVRDRVSHRYAWRHLTRRSSPDVWLTAEDTAHHSIMSCSGDQQLLSARSDHLSYLLYWRPNISYPNLFVPIRFVP